MLGRYQGPCRCRQNITDTASCLAGTSSKYMSRLVGEQTVAMLLCKQHNDSGEGFPRSDGRLPSLLEPTLRDANRDFQGQPICGCASIRFIGLQSWCPADFVGGYRSPFGTGLVGWVPLPPAGFCSGASMLLILVGLSTEAPFPGWFHELVWQLPVLARLSSAFVCPWNFRWTL